MKRLALFLVAALITFPALAQELELSAHDDKGNLLATNVGRAPVTILSAKVNYRDECTLASTGENGEGRDVMVSTTLVGPDKPFSNHPALLKTGDGAILGIYTTPCEHAKVVAIEIETDHGVVEFKR